MKVKLVFDAQFVGRVEEIVDYSDNITDDEIKASFEEHMGLKYDANCYFERLLVSDENKCN